MFFSLTDHYGPYQSFFVEKARCGASPCSSSQRLKKAPKPVKPAAASPASPAQDKETRKLRRVARRRRDLDRGMVLDEAEHLGRRSDEEDDESSVPFKPGEEAVMSRFVHYGFQIDPGKPNQSTLDANLRRAEIESFERLLWAEKLRRVVAAL